MRNVSDKFVKKIRTHILCSVTLSEQLYSNVEKYGTTRQAMNENATRRMRFEYWVNETTNTHSEYVILTALLSR